MSIPFVFSSQKRGWVDYVYLLNDLLSKRRNSYESNVFFMAKANKTVAFSPQSVIAEQKLLKWIVYCVRCCSFTKILDTKAEIDD